jgi:GNAT superfamily N-acetyltransferase
VSDSRGRGEPGVAGGPGAVGGLPLVAVTAEQVRPLRGLVLRPGQPVERLRYPGDEAPDTLHLAATREGRILAVASVMRDPHPHAPRDGDWRVRGMATDPSIRRSGLGTRLLGACEAHVRAHRGGRMWCNARVPARGLYERAGWVPEGAIFEIEDIGPHLLMVKRLD